ncbi:MAG: C40 family peptidase, partial [Actinomycetota bacterium]|nr:C40 family peptidase [Actinomycetota bacterium]
APVPVGVGAGAAVAAAKTRLGMPYVWGAAGPDSFDCSGLIQWAWAHAGVSLPHFSGAMYASTTHIPMSALQPGDLVFPSDPGSHVAMYIGGGQVIESPHTGDVVHIVPMYGWFVLASRV